MELTRVEQQPLDLIRVGEILAASRYFGVTPDQAVTQVLMGQELGLGPVASLTGIHVVQGRPEVGAHLIAGAIKRHDRYDYRVAEHTAQVCAIMFFEAGQELGVNRYSIDDARRAGLVNKGVWKQHPKAMLFARCISQGYRFFCPDVFSCPVYVDGEISKREPELETIIVESPTTSAERPDQAAIAVAEIVPRIRSLADVEERYPEFTELYRLEADDYQARVKLPTGKVEDCVGRTLGEAHCWQWAAETLGKEAWKELDDRSRALVLRAHQLRSDRKAQDLERRQRLAEELRTLADDDRRKELCKRLGLPLRRSYEAHTAVELEALLTCAKETKPRPRSKGRRQRAHDDECAQCWSIVCEWLHDQRPEDRKGRLAQLANAVGEDPTLAPVSVKPDELLAPWADNLPALRLFVGELEGRRIAENDR